MNKLTLQDYIELEKLIKNGAGEFEQQSFLLSRYYELEIDHVKNIDIRLINTMMNEMQEYVNKRRMSDKEVEDEITNMENKINKDHKEGKHEPIDDRFGILDL